jgi:valyl-tRNA synthetase
VKQESSKPSKPKPTNTAPAPLTPFVDPTAPGEKKLLQSFDHAHFSAYSPQAVEAGWYGWWEKSGFFQPKFTADGKVLPAGKFVVPLPPPNVTGALHCGHALANSLQDLLIRWHRMRWVLSCVPCAL